MFDDYPPQAQLPELYMWRHRLRVMEQILMEHHPEREHLKRLFQSEMVAAAEDAKALMRTRELTGAGALLDISWPPRNQIHLTVGRPSRIIPGMELTEESTTCRLGRLSLPCTLYYPVLCTSVSPSCTLWTVWINFLYYYYTFMVSMVEL